MTTDATLLALVRAAIESLDAAGALADYLDEIGDDRGRLLRRRWQAWMKTRNEYVGDAGGQRYREELITSQDGLIRKFTYARALSRRTNAQLCRDKHCCLDLTFNRYIRQLFPAKEFNLRSWYHQKLKTTEAA